jgi:hypothetical protein
MCVAIRLTTTRTRSRAEVTEPRSRLKVSLGLHPLALMADWHERPLLFLDSLKRLRRHSTIWTVISNQRMRVVSIEREHSMNRIITALTVFSMSLGTAAYAGAPSPVAPSEILAKPAPPSPATTQTYSSQSTMFRQAGLANNPNVPGATGYTILPGNNSTVAGDRLATQMEQTGAFGN